MKRAMALTLAGVMCIGITACGTNESTAESKTEVTSVVSDSSEKSDNTAQKAQSTDKSTEVKKKHYVQDHSMFQIDG